MRAGSRFRWRALAGLLLACAVLGSGCVYWRLHRLRSQLADWESYFEVTHEPGAVIRFRKPVLKPEDVEWLIGLEPVRGRSETGEEIATYLFRIRTPGRAPGDASEWDLRTDLVVRDGRIAEYRGQERFNKILNQETLTLAFRGVGKGKVNRRDTEAGWALDPELEIPRLRRVLAMMGPPVQKTETEIHDVLEYAYDLAPLEDDGAAAGPPDLSARLLLHRDEDRVVDAFFRIGILSVRVVDTPGRGYEAVVQR